MPGQLHGLHLPAWPLSRSSVACSQPKPYSFSKAEQWLPAVDRQHCSSLAFPAKHRWMDRQGPVGGEEHKEKVHRSAMGKEQTASVRKG